MQLFDCFRIQIIRIVVFILFFYFLAKARRSANPSQRWVKSIPGCEMTEYKKELISRHFDQNIFLDCVFLHFLFYFKYFILFLQLGDGLL